MKNIRITSKITYEINEFITWDEIIEIFSRYWKELQEYDVQRGYENLLNNIKYEKYHPDTFLSSMTCKDQIRIEKRLVYLLCNYNLYNYYHMVLEEQYRSICNYGG